MAQPEINQDLADPRVGVNSIYELLSSFVVGPNQIRRFTGGDGPLHTDDRPIVAYKAPLDLYQYASTENMIHIQRHANGIAHLMVKNSLPASEKKQFFENLARAYNQFIPGAQAGEIAELIASDL